MHLAALFIALMTWAPSTAPAQTLGSSSRCASCHLSVPASMPTKEHLADWQTSAHAKKAIGCERCHGGDPSAEEPQAAHRGVLNPAHFDSPVQPANLVRTCAPCHERNAQAFRRSLHYGLVQAADRRAPTCVTCHGVMSARVPSPSALEARCASCHQPGSARGQYPALMRAAVESLNAVSARETMVEDRVAALGDVERRVELMVALTLARDGIKNAVALVHNFEVSDVDARVAAVRRQLDAIEASVRPLP